MTLHPNGRDSEPRSCGMLLVWLRLQLIVGRSVCTQATYGLGTPRQVTLATDHYSSVRIDQVNYVKYLYAHSAGVEHAAA